MTSHENPALYKMFLLTYPLMCISKFCQKGIKPKVMPKSNESTSSPQLFSVLTRQDLSAR